MATLNGLNVFQIQMLILAFYMFNIWIINMFILKQKNINLWRESISLFFLLISMLISSNIYYISS